MSIWDEWWQQLSALWAASPQTGEAPKVAHFLSNLGCERKKKRRGWVSVACLKTKDSYAQTSRSLGGPHCPPHDHHPERCDRRDCFVPLRLASRGARSTRATSTRRKPQFLRASQMLFFVCWRGLTSVFKRGSLDVHRMFTSLSTLTHALASYRFGHETSKVQDAQETTGPSGFLHCLVEHDCSQYGARCLCALEALMPC